MALCHPFTVLGELMWRLDDGRNCGPEGTEELCYPRHLVSREFVFGY